MYQQSFNLLIDDLPISVLVKGIEYPINYQATTLIAISILIEDSDFEPEIMADKQLKLFYPTIPDDRYEAMLSMIEFYSSSDDMAKTPETTDNKDTPIKRSYSFKHDSALIYVAFLQQYPTVRIQNLHWFVFKSLLSGLTEECMFVKVTQWRAIKITGKMSKEEKKFYRKMKLLYLLPDNRPQNEKDKDFSNELARL